MQSPVFWLDEIDSTNAHAGRLLAQGHGESCWIIARRQRAGRGRQGRHWASQDGNFMGSYLWPIGDRLDDVQGLSLAVGLAVRACVAQFYVGDRDVLCKWPNDVMIGDQKVAGILMETHSSGFGQFWGILGIGVNLVETTLDQRTVSHVGTDGGEAPSLEVFSERLLPAVEAKTNHWPPSDRESFQREWQSSAFGLHQAVEVEGRGKGRFEGIETTGEAIVTLATGQPCLVQAGDLTFCSLGNTS